MYPHLYDHTAYAVNPLTIQTLLVALGIIALGIFALVRARASHVGLVFFVLASSIGLWLFAYSWMYSAVDEKLALWWARAGQVGIACIPAAVYNFNALIVEDYEKVRIKVLASWFLSILFAMLMIATDIHFGSLYHYRWGYYPRLHLTSIPFILYFFGVMIVAMKSYVGGYRRALESSVQLKRARTLAVAFAVAYFAALDFIPSFGIPLYPFGYIPISLFIVIAAGSILRYRFTAITPAIAARQIIETMKDGLIVFDADGVVRMVNQATCSLLGYQEQDLVGKRPAMSMISGTAFAKKLEAIIGSGAFSDHELEYRELKKSPRTLSLSASLIRNSIGEPAASICLLTDITGRKHAESERENLITQLQKANDKLQAMDKMKSEFVSVVSHELRTPLTTIKAFIELLIMRPDMPEQKKAKFMNMINAETDRLKRLISDHLDLARIESGVMSWSIELISMEEIIEISVSGIRPLCENKGLSLSTAFTAPLSRFSGDRDRLIQVVTNILSNAVKFTPSGGAIHIRVGQESTPVEQIVVTISDTGIGIPGRDLELIFEKFRRSGDQFARVIEGTGLGLSIAREIIVYHGGRIWATSSQGHGSTFTFTLPITRNENSGPMHTTVSDD